MTPGQKNRHEYQRLEDMRKSGLDASSQAKQPAAAANGDARERHSIGGENAETEKAKREH
jgi:hypothetical protein